MARTYFWPQETNVTIATLTQNCQDVFAAFINIKDGLHCDCVWNKGAIVAYYQEHCAPLADAAFFFT